MYTFLDFVLAHCKVLLNFWITNSLAFVRLFQKLWIRK